MNVRHLVFASLALVAVACAPSTETEEAGAEAAAASEEVNAADPGTISVGGITLKTELVSASVKAKNPPSQFNPSFDSCKVDVEHFVIEGTAHDAATNQHLRGRWQLPTAESCIDAHEYTALGTLKLLDPEQGLLAMTIGETSYTGGFHPSLGMQFEVIDLRTGALLTLGDYVKDDATQKVLDLVYAAIDASVPANQRENMKDAAYSSFARREGEQVVLRKPAELRDFLVTGTGLQIDLANQFNSVGVDAGFEVKWDALERAGALRADTDLVARTKAARAK